MAGTPETSQGFIFPRDQIPQVSAPQNLGFRQVEPPSDRTVSTAIDISLLHKIARFEENIWGESFRPLDRAVDQVKQEYEEEKEIWTSIIEGETSLEDKETVHEIRAEIGDGIIAGLGAWRSLHKGDDIEAARNLQKLLLQPVGKPRSPEQRITLYNLRAQGFLDLHRQLPKGKNVHNFNAKEKETFINSLGAMIRSGLQAIEELGMDPNQLLLDKYRIMNMKYVGREGSLEKIKDTWNARQLPVLDFAIQEAA